MGIKFQTDQSGANNNVCSGTSLTFNFSVTSNSTVDSATFVIKKGSGTSASIIATIYDAINGGGDIVEAISVSSVDVSQTFGNIVFTFSNTNLTANRSYSLVVSSSTSCSGSNPYSMKSGNFQVLDNSNNVINTGYGISASTSSTASSTLSAKQTHNLSSTLATVNSVTAQATKSTPPGGTNRIKLDGNNVPVKIYLGNTRRKVYKSNRLIIDKF